MIKLNHQFFGYLSGIRVALKKDYTPRVISPIFQGKKVLLYKYINKLVVTCYIYLDLEVNKKYNIYYFSFCILTSIDVIVSIAVLLNHQYLKQHKVQLILLYLFYPRLLQSAIQRKKENKFIHLLLLHLGVTRSLRSIIYLYLQWPPVVNVV